jgi:threonine/homoserine/homoserine lactone efflux protein
VGLIPGLTAPTAALFLGTALLIELTPGPNMAYLAVLAATEGRRPGLAAVAGVALGLTLLGLLAALGLAAVVGASPPLSAGLRWAGVAYLLWLAWEAWRDAAADQAESLDQTLAGYFGRGLMTNLLNPKAAAFYVTVLPPFLNPDAAVLPQTLTLSALYVLVATLVHGTIVMFAGSAARLLTDTAQERRLRRIGAATLVGVALWLALD